MSERPDGTADRVRKANPVISAPIGIAMMTSSAGRRQTRREGINVSIHLQLLQLNSKLTLGHDESTVPGGVANRRRHYDRGGGFRALEALDAAIPRRNDAGSSVGRRWPRADARLRGPCFLAGLAWASWPVLASFTLRMTDPEASFGDASRKRSLRLLSLKNRASLVIAHKFPRCAKKIASAKWTRRTSSTSWSCANPRDRQRAAGRTPKVRMPREFDALAGPRIPLAQPFDGVVEDLFRLPVRDSPRRSRCPAPAVRRGGVSAFANKPTATAMALTTACCGGPGGILAIWVARRVRQTAGECSKKPAPNSNLRPWIRASHATLSMVYSFARRRRSLRTEKA